jgi:hypothetical protein
MAVGCLFTVLTPPVTYLLLSGGKYQINLGSVGASTDSSFSDFINFANFLWSWLSLGVAPWLFFFCWHYPFWNAIRRRRGVGGGTGAGFVASVGPRERESVISLAAHDSGRAAINDESTGLLAPAVAGGGAPVVIIPTGMHVFASLVGCTLFICFCAMQFIGAPSGGAGGSAFPPNFLSASGIGFFLQCDNRGFNMRLTAHGVFAAGTTLVSNSSWWAIYAVALLSTFMWALLLIIGLVWFFVVARHLWKFSGGQAKPIVVVNAALLVVGIVMIFLYIFVFTNFTKSDAAAAYRRSICVKNGCRSAVVVGVTGGSTGIPCSEGPCPNGTACNTLAAEPHYCFFTLSTLSGLLLAPGQRACHELSAPVASRITPPHQGVQLDVQQWSGNLYARTHCSGGGAAGETQKCQTGICGVHCGSSFAGPTGPTTLAEMTLQVGERDYYDISVINGANVPLSVTPFNAVNSFMLNPDRDSTPATQRYWCSTVGRTAWKFSKKDLAPEYRLVVPQQQQSPSSATACSDDSACTTAGEVCGMAMVLTDAMLPTTQTKMICGVLAGIWTQNERCVWTGNTYSGCSAAVSGGGTQAELLGCYGTYATSCFQTTASSTCCGCSVWSDLGMTGTMPCYATNPSWTSTVEPPLKWIKKGAGDVYTYPFDDSTSTMQCRGFSVDAAATNTTNNSSSASASRSNTRVNDASYEIEFCPDGVEIGFSD